VAHVVVPARELVFIPLEPTRVGLVGRGFVTLGTAVAVLAGGQ